MAGLVFFADCGTLETKISGLGATGGGVGLLVATTNFGLGASGGFLISRKEKKKKKPDDQKSKAEDKWLSLRTVLLLTMHLLGRLLYYIMQSQYYFWKFCKLLCNSSTYSFWYSVHWLVNPI